MKKAVKKEMKLRYKDFALIPSQNAKDRFDLFVLTKNQKTGKDYDKLIGYGYRLDEAIHQIISELLSENLDIDTLKGYVDAYKNAVKEISNVLK